jgi:ABC-type taurine transport system substrate-binding protein
MDGKRQRRALTAAEQTIAALASGDAVAARLGPGPLAQAAQRHLDGSLST